MRRFSSFSLIVIILTIMAIGLMTTTTYAQEAQSENKVARFFKNLVKWPFGVTKKGVETVGDTSEKAAETVVKTTSSTVDTVTGKPERIKDVVIEPVKGSAETAYTAAEGAIKTPIEGTKESFE